MAKVLIVDDGSGSLDILRNVCARVDAEAVFVASAEEAIGVYQSGAIDVVLSEVRMPKIDGLVLTRKLRRIDRDALVILMTALERKSDLLEAIKLGVFDFFIKPFAVGEFAESLQRAFALRERLAAASKPRGPVVAAMVDDSELRERESKLAAKETELRNRELALREGEAALEEAMNTFDALGGTPPPRKGASSQAVSDDNVPPAVAGELAAREQALAEREAALAERETALSAAESQLEEAMARMDSGVGGMEARMGDGGVIDEEDLVAREAAVREMEAMLKEREAFLEQSENALFEKGQRLQEMETELEHRSDVMGMPEGAGMLELDPEREAELVAREQAVRSREMQLDAKEAGLIERERKVAKTEAIVKAREQYLRTSENILFEKED